MSCVFHEIARTKQQKYAIFPNEICQLTCAAATVEPRYAKYFLRQSLTELRRQPKRRIWRFALYIFFNLFAVFFVRCFCLFGQWPANGAQHSTTNGCLEWLRDVQSCAAYISANGLESSQSFRGPEEWIEKPLKAATFNASTHTQNQRIKIHSIKAAILVLFVRSIQLLFDFWSVVVSNKTIVAKVKVERSLWQELSPPN